MRSGSRLSTLLQTLSASARAKGWSDSEWARRSGVPKETLCRLRSRQSCDFATLEALAEPLGASLGVATRRPAVSKDGLWPTAVNRALELQLLDLVESGSVRAENWRSLGPPFFLAGFATMVASLPGFERDKYLALAELLHPGSTEPRVFELWLRETPTPPARVVPMLEAQFRHEA
jgi:hypothetical protein